MALLLLLSGCALFSADPNVRSAGQLWADERLESRVTRALRSSSDGLRSAHLSVKVNDGLVLLLGQVRNATDRELAGSKAQDVTGVRRVHNELTLGGVTSYLARANDRWLGTKVRSALLAAEDTRIEALRVVTEAGNVYLLGRVTRAQADAAVDRTRRVFGVQRVVKVFDYLDADGPATAQPLAQVTSSATLRP